MYLLRNESFWSVKSKSSVGSWMWRKLLKLRNQAKHFHRVEIKNGRGMSFWYDHWSTFGRLNDMLGERGYIDLGISKSATVADVIQNYRRRRHRVVILNKIEEEITEIRDNMSNIEEDVHKWKKKTRQVHEEVLLESHMVAYLGSTSSC